MSDRSPLPPSSPVWRHRARVLKALGHPTRLFLVEHLADGETCVCELAELVGADISTVSRHLAVLRDAGILADERRGTQVFYQVVSPVALELVSLAGRAALEAAVRERAALADLTGLTAASEAKLAPEEARS